MFRQNSNCRTLLLEHFVGNDNFGGPSGIVSSEVDLLRGEVNRLKRAPGVGRGQYFLTAPDGTLESCLERAFNLA